MSQILQRSPVADTPDWQMFSGCRTRQKRAGLFSAIILLIALVVLVDGLVSQMRGGGSYRIEMQAGTSEPISGPMGSQKAKPEDMEAFPIPADAPVSFEFEGFFSSYWFGTGMWRGTLHAAPDAESGTYGMAVGVSGMPAGSYQTYTVVIASNKAEADAQSYSFVRRFLGLNPFYIAIIFAAIGLGAAAGAIMLGRRCDKLVSDMGFGEIFKVLPDAEFLRVFTVTGQREVSGRAFEVFDESLQRLGKVIYDRTAHGFSECLFVPDKGDFPKKGGFVAFWEPHVPPQKPLRRGLVSSLLEKPLAKDAPADSSASEPKKEEKNQA